MFSKKEKPSEEIEKILNQLFSIHASEACGKSNQRWYVRLTPEAIKIYLEQVHSRDWYISGQTSKKIIDLLDELHKTSDL